MLMKLNLQSYITIIFVFFFFILPLRSFSADVIQGYINEFSLNEQVSDNISSSTNNYSYIKTGPMLIVAAYKLGDKFTLDNSTGTFKVSGEPPEWRFHKDKKGYGRLSGTSALHRLEASLPDCTLGNICKPGASFSLAITGVNEANSGAIHFYVNNEDVTTFFYYDVKNERFRVKQYNEARFFSFFKGNDDYLSWKSDNKKVQIEGNVRILLANRAIKGKVVTPSGSVPKKLIGKKVNFYFAGSDYIVPHSLQAVINERGEYYLDGLATFAYKPSFDIIQNNKIVLNSLTTRDNTTVLDILCVVPDYNYIISNDEDYRAGEFLIIKGSDLHPSLQGNIQRFEQIAGDSVRLGIVKNRFTMILPVERVLPDDLFFQGEIDNKTILLKIKHPVPARREYVQYSLFSTEGIYARTAITKLNNGLLAANTTSMLSASVDSFYSSSQNNVKAHIFDENGTATDVTPFFSWDDDTQSLKGKEESRTRFYDILQNTNVTLIVTFCSKTDPDICFRIRDRLKPGGAGVEVRLGKTGSGKYAILRQINVVFNPVVAVSRANKNGIVAFDNVPQGKYIIIYADTELKHYGYNFATISAEDNAKKRTIEADIPLRPIGENLNDKLLSVITNGNIQNINDGPIKLFPNDYKDIDLKQLGLPDKENISSVQLLGELPGSYILYPDKILRFTTVDSYKDRSSVMLLESNNNIYTLSIVYAGTDKPVITQDKLDYSMCPSSRPVCGNAFVDVKGVTRGIYDGKNQLAIVFPLSFNRSDVKIMMESINDITEMFSIEPKYRRVVLKKSAIPEFLSNLSTNREPVAFYIKDQIYRLHITAGYKSIEVSVVDEDGGETSLFSGMDAHLACEYKQDELYSHISRINRAGTVVFTDLPDCDYRLTLIDYNRMFYGVLNNLSLTTGQNRLRTMFPVSCVGNDDQFMRDCNPLIPIISNNRMISPDIGVIFTDKYLPFTIKASVKPEDSGMRSSLLGRGVVLFDNGSVQSSAIRTLILTDEDNNSVNIELNSSYIYNVLIKTLSWPSGYKKNILKVQGVDNSLIFNNRTPIRFVFDTELKYRSEEITVSVDYDGELEDISTMFMWDSNTNILSLKNSSLPDFTSLLDGRQRSIIFTIGKGDVKRQYVISAVIGAGVADITLDVTVNGKSVQQGKALLIGRASKNQYEYRQLATVNKNGRTYFSNIPRGGYELIFFDMDANAYGSRELSVHADQSDLYVTIDAVGLIK